MLVVGCLIILQIRNGLSDYFTKRRYIAFYGLENYF